MPLRYWEEPESAKAVRREDDSGLRFEQTFYNIHVLIQQEGGYAFLFVFVMWRGCVQSHGPEF